MKKKSFDWSAFRRYLPYLTAYAKETWAAVVLGIAAGVSSVYMTYQIGQAVDQLIGADQVQFSALYRILLLFAGVVLVTVVSQWLIQRLGNRVAYLSVADLRKKVLRISIHCLCAIMTKTPTATSSVVLPMTWIIFPLPSLQSSTSCFLVFRSS